MSSGWSDVKWQKFQIGLVWASWLFYQHESGGIFLLSRRWAGLAETGGSLLVQQHESDLIYGRCQVYATYCPLLHVVEHGVGKAVLPRLLHVVWVWDGKIVRFSTFAAAVACWMLVDKVKQFALRKHTTQQQELREALYYSRATNVTAEGDGFICWLNWFS